MARSLVMIGNPYVLLEMERHFPKQCWAALLTDCLKHNAIVKSTEDMLDVDLHKLSAALLSSSKNDDNGI